MIKTEQKARGFVQRQYSKSSGRIRGYTDTEPGQMTRPYHGALGLGGGLLKVEGIPIYPLPQSLGPRPILFSIELTF